MNPNIRYIKFKWTVFYDFKNRIEYCQELLQLFTLCDPNQLSYDIIKTQLIGQSEFRMDIGMVSGDARAMNATSTAIKARGWLMF